MFTTNYTEITEIIDRIDPEQYCRTRNHIDGAVTRLSPYISRGVISTRFVAERILAKGYQPSEIDCFLKELAWRDYFQQTWIALDDDINSDIRQEQQKVRHHGIPGNLVEARTSIRAIDEGIRQLYESGYVHNHVRMYIASIACNIAQSHWSSPARWMYYHLLDADWASNTLSWQWVAGSFSNKKYFANQENINKYCHTDQSKTFLDVPYESFEEMDIPAALREFSSFHPETYLPAESPMVIDPSLPVYVYNFYNLDCLWQREVKASRILLLEPSFFRKYPVSDKTIAFILKLAENIGNIQVCVKEFDELYKEAGTDNFHFKEHPSNRHYTGEQHQRDWICDSVTGYYPSFFSYWKQCTKHSELLKKGFSI